MNKDKISPELLSEVSILKNLKNKQNVLVFSSNFDKIKKFLDNNKYFYTPYRFAQCFKIDADEDDLSIFSEQENVNYIFPNSIVSAESKEKEIMNFSHLTDNKFLGQGQTICFIDTGISPHFDFLFPRNRIVKFIDLINHSTTPYDDNGHGTFVSGIACGGGILSNDNLGFAPKSNIISIKALSKDGNSNSNVILDAMQWVYENHKAYNIGIVCMSFGADANNNIDPLSKGAEALWKRGIVVVAAAGNSGPERSTIKSPGNNPNIITVGALDVTNMNIADFSSRGPTIYGHKPDLLAPAVDITSCSNLSTPYTKMSGTSVATPIIAGICADIKCKHPNMTNVEIKNFLLKNCTRITGNIDIEGAGYLNFSNIML